MIFNDLIHRIFKKRDSTFIAILGPKESGKTDLALRILESLHQQNLYKYFGTNIEGLSNTPCEIDTITDLPTLLDRCKSLNKRYLFILDELGDTAPKDMPWLNVELIKSLQKVRKYKLSLIGCAIDRVDSRVLNPTHFYGYFKKVSPDKKNLAVYTDWLKRKRTTVEGIRPTTISFDTYQVASFHMQRASNSHIYYTVDQENVFKYLDAGCSWKRAGIHPQTGKNSTIAVLKEFRELLKTLNPPAQNHGESTNQEGLARESTTQS